MNVIGYVRVSTREQGDSGLGLDAQTHALQAEAERRGWTLTIVTDVASGKDTTRRPALTDALARLDRGQADALAVAKLDRLSRSMVDFSGILARASRRHWSVFALDLGVDTSTPTGEAFAHMLMTFAQWERRIIGERTKNALAAAKRRGQRLGQTSGHKPDALAYAVTMRAAGLSYRKIAQTLTAEGYPTAGGFSTWHETSVARALRTARLDAEAAAAHA